MKRLFLIVCTSLFFAACGGAGLGTSSSKLDIKVGGKDSTLNVKSGAVEYSRMAFTVPGKPSIQTSLHTIYIANYELDTTTPGKSLTAPDQMLVEIRLTGEDGTTENSPFKVATYSAKADKFNGVGEVKIITFAGGKQTDTRFDSSFGNEKVNGEVKITAVTTDSISGEVNLTEGDKSIKGSFTAKLPTKKK